MGSRAARGFAFVLTALVSLACGDPAPSLEGGDAPPANDASAVPRRNLLLITLDTTRADALGAYGQVLDTSPNLDRLAAGGVLFEDVSSSHPETLPSHATIFTGRWPFEHGVRSNSGYLLSDAETTLAERLRDAGYRTGAEVSALVLRSETRITQGFDHYRGPDSPNVVLKRVRDGRGASEAETRDIRVGSDVSAGGIGFMRSHRAEPFFLWLHYFDAHVPYAPPPGFERRFPDSPYHAGVAYADYQVGIVLRELDRLGLRDRTLVVVTADHGEALEEHGEPTHSYFVYDATIRVPLVLAGLRDLPRGVRVPHPVRTADVAPTILDLLDLPPLERARGRSLVPLISDPDLDPKLLAYGEASALTAQLGIPPLRFVRRGPWKYIHKVNPELYDVVADPGEVRNLAGARADVSVELRGVLAEMLAAAPDTRGETAAVDAETAAQLMALGYVAWAPSFEIRDGPDALALSGEDPATKVEDLRVMSRAREALRRGEYAEALADAETLRARNPGASYPLELLARALIGLGRFDEALGVAAELRAARPGDHGVVYLQAEALAGAGRGDEATGLLRELLDLDACHERARLDQNQLLYDLGRFEERLAMLADGAKRCPELRSNRNNYAWALATTPVDDLRDGPAAVRVARELLALDPENPAYLDTLAAALAETGDFEGAAAAQREAIERLEALNAEPRLSAALRRHLERYRSGKPVRDPAGS